MGRIGEKNSRMRQGLWVSGPHYFPGHKTYIYLRVQNLTADTIKIKKEDKIAQIFFEQLTEEPENAYSDQQNASFKEEDQYRGMGRYADEYEERIGKIHKASEDLDEKIDHIYANILTLMGIFVSVFSLITINLSNLGKKFSNIKYMTVMFVLYACIMAILIISLICVLFFL